MVERARMPDDAALRANLSAAPSGDVGGEITVQVQAGDRIWTAQGMLSPIQRLRDLAEQTLIRRGLSAGDRPHYATDVVARIARSGGFDDPKMAGLGFGMALIMARGNGQDPLGLPRLTSLRIHLMPQRDGSGKHFVHIDLSVAAAVAPDVVQYQQMAAAVDARKARNKAALAELSAEFDKRLAALKAPDTRERIEAVMASRGRLKQRPKAGVSF